MIVGAFARAHTPQSDTPFRERYLADPNAAMREIGLTDDECRALESLDRDTLVDRGAHPYLVFMAALRRRMDRGQGTLEYF